ncbi:hypothetical protein [Halomontanus rarus]|uniref:hypothetical protein n=1 Tax=Halomontanus rarus TaxID=3034020 RepID=UPI001A986830
MSKITHGVYDLDRLDKRILVALDDNVLSAKEICEEWALPSSDSSRVRYRIRERLGVGAERLVQIYDAVETPGDIYDRNLYALTDRGQQFVARHREALTTPESIDELREDLDDVHTDLQRVDEMADDAMDVATSQRERINGLQRDKYTLNERSKENRERLQSLEREVFETDWDSSLRDLIAEIEEESQNRDEDIRNDLDVQKKQLMRRLVTADEFTQVKADAERGRNWSKALLERVRELENELDEERERNENLTRRLNEIERRLNQPGRLKSLFVD